MYRTVSGIGVIIAVDTGSTKREKNILLDNQDKYTFIYIKL